MDKRRNNLQNGITLIALVISIIVMLILAGVSLNATIGDNGIITQAQNATYLQSIAVLEEYFNEKYVESYEELTDVDSKIAQLQNIYPECFYIPSLEGIGSLRYVVDKEGHALYLIKKSGLPKEIQKQIIGGVAGEGTYTDYLSLNDVYGITTELKVFYCSKGLDSIEGIDIANLDNDNPNRTVIDSSNKIYSQIETFDIDGDGIISSKESRSVTEMEITADTSTFVEELYKFSSLVNLKFYNVTLENLNGLKNCSNLKYIYFENPNIADYSAIGTSKNSLIKLYFYNIDDNELKKICSKSIGIGDYDFPNLAYFGFFGNKNILSIDGNTNINYFNSYWSGKSTRTVSDITCLNDLTDNTKNAIKYLYINNNNIKSISYLNKFSNLYLLRAECNALENLIGLESTNIKYLMLAANQLGKNESYDTSFEIEKQYSETDALKAIENNTSIYYLRISENYDLKFVKYLKNISSVRYFYGGGLNQIVDANNLVKLKKVSSPNFYFPSKYELDLLDADLTTSLDFSNYSLTLSNLEAIKQCKNIYRLNLNNTTYVDNSGNVISNNIINLKLNDCLSNLKEMQYLTLKNISALNSIDFVTNQTKLKQLILDGTTVADLSKLDSCTSLAHLSINYLTSSSTLSAKTIKCCVNRSRYDWSMWGNRSAWQSSMGISLNSPSCFNAITWPTDLTCFSCFGNYSSGGDVIDLSACSKIQHVNNYSGNKLKVNATSLTNIMTNNNSLSFVGSGDTIEIYTDDYNTSYFGTVYTMFKNITFSCLSGNVSWLGDANQNFKNAVVNISFGGSCYAHSLNFNDLNEYKYLKYISFSNGSSYQYNATWGDISTLTNLEEIRLYYIKNINLEYLPLASLKKLTIQGCNISSISQIAECHSLSYLDLSNNPLYDLSYKTDGTPISTTEILATLNKSHTLKSLFISNHNINDLSELQSLNWTEKSGF